MAKMKTYLSAKFVVTAFIAAAASGALAQTASAAVPAKEVLTAKLPKTPIDKISCEEGTSFCEVQSGKNIFYVDREGKHLFLGHIYDLNLMVDITEAKLKGLSGASASEANGGDVVRQMSGKSEGSTKLSLKGLSAKGAIIRGSANSPTVVVFSDLRCGYCRAVLHELEAMNVRIVEYPISILGSRELANSVICAADKSRAIKDAYAGVPLEPGKCDTSGLDENERFARENRLNQTPVLVRSDGSVLYGFRPRAVLEKWIKGQ